MCTLNAWTLKMWSNYKGHPETSCLFLKYNLIVLSENTMQDHHCTLGRKRERTITHTCMHRLADLGKKETCTHHPLCNPTTMQAIRSGVGSVTRWYHCPSQPTEQTLPLQPSRSFSPPPLHNYIIAPIHCFVLSNIVRFYFWYVWSSRQIVLCSFHNNENLWVCCARE